MPFFTVLSKSKDGVRRSMTLEADSEEAAVKAAEHQNQAIADQEQTEAYTVAETTQE